jgi:hypothetical protein
MVRTAIQALERQNQAMLQPQSRLLHGLLAFPNAGADHQSLGRFQPMPHRLIARSSASRNCIGRCIFWVQRRPASRLAASRRE